jgi:hypothetical protein
METIEANDLKIGSVFCLHRADSTHFYEVTSIRNELVNLRNGVGKICTTSLDFLRASNLYTKTQFKREYIAQENTNVCKHTKKFKNHAGGTYFWYCPCCKNDLGNV